MKWNKYFLNEKLNYGLLTIAALLGEGGRRFKRVCLFVYFVLFCLILGKIFQAIID